MSEPMRRWAVTGPTGAGKTLLVDFLAERGAAVISGDLIGHELLRWPEIIAQVVQEFGSDLLRGDAIDRSALGRVVFSEPAALVRLGAITHPLLAAEVNRRFAQLAASGRTALAVLEAAVYFLLPSLDAIDLTITVLAGREVRLQRLIDAGGLTARQARQRIDAQQPLEHFWSRADLVLYNEGTPSEFVQAASCALASHWPQLRTEARPREEESREGDHRQA